MSLLSLKKISPRVLWFRRVAVVLVLVGLIGGFFGYRPVLQRYRVWKQQRALAQARDFLAQKDPVNAKLAIEVALNATPGSPEALQVAAQLLQQVGSSEELPLRRRLVQLSPDSAAERAALVLAALRHRDFNTAREALADMSPAQASEPPALKAALAYALATDNKPVADALYDRLKALEPGNTGLAVMHALLRLHLPRPEAAAAARAELEKLATVPAQSLFIRRELMLDAMRRKDPAEAKRLAALVLADPRATLADRLHQANLSLNVDHRPFAEVWTELAPAVPRDVAAATELTRWLMAVNQPEEARRWLDGLPAAVQADPVMTGLRADLAVARRDWDGLAALLEAGAWGGMHKDALRLAFAARVAAERGNENLQRQLWDEAIAVTSNSLNSLRLLHQLAGAWGWKEPAERCLWAVTRVYPNQGWAHQALFNAYREREDTESLRSLMNTLRELDGSVPRYRHDWALLSLLLNRTTEWTLPKTTLAELHASDPANESYAVGHAFALAQSNRGAEALVIVDKLSPQARALPARIPYLAFIYGAGRRQADFEAAAAGQASLTRLLPEERRLFELGRELLTRPLPRPASPAKKTEAKPVPPPAVQP